MVDDCNSLTEGEKQLVAGNVRLLYEFARRKLKNSSFYQINFENADEVISTATFGLIRAAQTFNPKIAKFSTWANRLMHQTCVHEVLCRKQFPELLDKLDIYVEYLTELNGTEDYEIYINELTPLQRYIVNGIVDDKSLELIGSQLGLTKSQINKAIKKMRKNMRKKFYKSI